MKEKEIFGQLIRYFPEGQEDRIYRNMRAFAKACLEAGEFAEADKYADYLLAQDKDEERRVSACRIKLFTKLQCKTNEEFLHCEKFSKDMPEYEELVAACAFDEERLASCIKFADENFETVAKDRAKRAQEEIVRKQNEKEKNRKKKLNAELLQLRSKADRFDYARWACMIISTVMLLSGIIAWISLGWKMPYRVPAFWLLFLITVCGYIAGIVCDDHKEKTEEELSAMRTKKQS